jgi:hypothetical protein
MGAISATKLEFRPIPGTAPWHKKVKGPSHQEPDWPVNYFVPNFGKDVDIKRTQKSI